jgi:hypothetical protein
VVTLKNLVVGIAGNLVFPVDETLVQWENNRMVLLADIFVVGLVETFKDVVETLGLRCIRTKQVVYNR